MERDNGSQAIHSPGPWAQLVAVINCPCSDGKRRKVRITGQPDTFFSIPGSVSVRSKTVTGYVTTAPDYKAGVKEGYIFQPAQYGKNHELLPDWSDDILRNF